MRASCHTHSFAGRAEVTACRSVTGCPRACGSYDAVGVAAAAPAAAVVVPLDATPRRWPAPTAFTSPSEGLNRVKAGTRNCNPRRSTSVRGSRRGKATQSDEDGCASFWGCLHHRCEFRPPPVYPRPTLQRVAAAAVPQLLHQLAAAGVLPTSPTSGRRGGPEPAAGGRCGCQLPVPLEEPSGGSMPSASSRAPT